MEYVPGPTIRSLLTLDGRLPPHLAVEYTAQAAEALDMAYQESHVMHRNLTPTNLMLDWWGRVKVMDFGLARVPGLPPMTTASTLLTSIAYASPEHLQGRSLDHRSDVYALGVMLYEMLTGSPPFVGRTPQEMVQAILAGPSLFPTHLFPALSPAFPQILVTALAVNRDARFAEAGVMAKALRELRLLVPSAPISDAFQEADAGARQEQGERASDFLPKPLTLPIRNPHTPLPGLLSYRAEAFQEERL
jgi:serine/threonine-protein kinase